MSVHAEPEQTEHPERGELPRSVTDVALPEQTNPMLAGPEVSCEGEANASAQMSAPQGTRAASAFVFFTVALDMLALGMIARCCRT